MLLLRTVIFLVKNELWNSGCYLLVVSIGLSNSLAKRHSGAPTGSYREFGILSAGCFSSRLPVEISIKNKTYIIYFKKITKIFKTNFNRVYAV